MNGGTAVVTIDTGFTGSLSLCGRDMRRLGFRGPRGEEACVLGDGAVIHFPIYEGTLSWLGRRRKVSALLSPSDDNLLGMGLLELARLTLAPARGHVVVDPA